VLYFDAISLIKLLYSFRGIPVIIEFVRHFTASQSSSKNTATFIGAIKIISFGWFIQFRVRFIRLIIFSYDFSSCLFFYLLIPYAIGILFN